MSKQTFHQGETIQFSISAVEYDMSASDFVLAIFRECYDEDPKIFNKSDLVETEVDERKIYTLVIPADATKSYKTGLYSIELKVNDSLATHVATANNIIELLPAKTKNLINS